MKKVRKLPGEGTRWKWKALNTTSWKGSPAKRMPGFHLRKKKKLGGKGRGKGKRKGLKSRTTAVTAATLSQPPTAPVAQPVASVSSQPQAVAAPVSSAPLVPVAPGAAVWSSGEPAIVPQPTSNPQAVPGSNFVFNPQTQTWIPRSVTAAPMGWAAETIAPKSMPIVSTTTIAPAIWAPAVANAALRGAPTSFPPVVSSTLSPMAHHPAPAQFAPTFAAQYQAFSTTTPVFWR